MLGVKAAGPMDLLLQPRLPGGKCSSAGPAGVEQLLSTRVCKKYSQAQKMRPAELYMCELEVWRLGRTLSLYRMKAKQTVRERQMVKHSCGFLHWQTCSNAAPASESKVS